MTASDKPAFAQAMAALCLGLREKDPDAAQMRVYFEALKELPVEIVVQAAQRLGQAVDEHGKAWMPKAAEWRAVALSILAERTAAQEHTVRQRRLRGQPPLCLACDDTGFVYHAQSNSATVCECRILRRLEVEGRRPLPELLALPEAPDQVRVIDADAVARALASTKGMQ